MQGIKGNINVKRAARERCVVVTSYTPVSPTYLLLLKKIEKLASVRNYGRYFI